MKLKKKWRKFLHQTLILGSLPFFSPQAHAHDLKLVPYVDIPRYMGDWYVIANIPNFIEKDCIRSIESYALRPDGKIDNGFVCHKADGSSKRLTSLAWIKDPQTQAEWRVRFNWDTFFGNIPIPIHFGYYVIDLDAQNYSYTVVGHPSRDLLWIMSREQTMSEALYRDILQKVKAQGYDTSRIIRLPQTPSQPFNKDQTP
jgi:apolipoprotein D and lipocalin family protein